MITVFDVNYYTIKEIALKSGINYSTLYRWIHDSDLELKRIGKRSYLTEQMLENLLDKLS